MSGQGKPYGLLADYQSAAELAAAIRRLWDAGYREIDGYAPVPSPEVDRALGETSARMPVVALACGLLGAGLAYFLQWYSAVIDYPFVVGGRTLHAWPAFMQVTFEVGVLSAVLGAVAAMLWLNGFPRPHHPLFDAPDFERAGRDLFMLCVRSDDPHFDAERTAALIRETQPRRVTEVRP